LKLSVIREGWDEIFKMSKVRLLREAQPHQQVFSEFTKLLFTFAPETAIPMAFLLLLLLLSLAIKNLS
jgi:hypothetical protein